MTTEVSGSASNTTTVAGGLAVEANGINVIAESERKGTPRGLFWPWCAANIAVLAISYGSFLLGFGISIWQATIAGVVGTVISFLLVGLVALAGKRGSAPTMVLSRASFGVRGNALPSACSYILLVGWEVVLVSLSTLATATVFERLGWSHGDVTKVSAFVIVAAVIVLAGIMGFDAIIKLQTWLTIVLAVATVGYILLTLKHIHWHTATAVPSGSAKGLLGAVILAATALGVGWVNAGADYSRYLPRSASSRGVVGWTTFGASIAPVILIVYGVLLVASNGPLSNAIGADPIGALTTLLPKWYLVPFVIVAVGGLVSGAVLDIYSSGLTLLTLGLPIQRWQAAAVDGVLMVAGSIYVVFFEQSFQATFTAFLITLGVPIAAWCGVFLGDLALRRGDYDQAALYDARGRYGSVGWVAVIALLAGTVLGWGLITSATKGFTWQGYLLGPIGLGGKGGDWAYANLGVLAALIVGFVAPLVFSRTTIRSQETQQTRAAGV
jgi:NCS1 family nucleobase:cation symporter-1